MLPPVMSQHPIVLAALLKIQLLAVVPGEAAADDPSAWGSTTHMGDLDVVPSSWVWPGPALAGAVIWQANQWIQALPLFL